MSALGTDAAVDARIHRARSQQCGVHDEGCCVLPKRQKHVQHMRQDGSRFVSRHDSWLLDHRRCPPLHHVDRCSASAEPSSGTEGPGASPPCDDGPVGAPTPPVDLSPSVPPIFAASPTDVRGG